MHETDLNPTHPSSEPAEGLEAAALRAQAWYGEPFLHAGEEPAAALAPGTARRGALDDALAEMDAGRADSLDALARPLRPHARPRARARRRRRPRPRPAPSSAVIRSTRSPGMLTELIAANQRDADENGNGNGNGAATAEADAAELDEEDDDFDAGVIEDEIDDEPAFTRRGSRAPHAATASATRRRPARRSPQPGSSSRRAISAS